MRQAEVQQVDAIDAGRDRDQPADERHDRRDPGDPRCRDRVGNRLERLHFVFGAAESRRKRVEDQRQRQRVLQDELGDREARRPTRQEEKREDRRNRGEPDDVALVQIRDCGGLAGDHRPLRLRGQQNALDACDQLVEVHGRSPRLSLFGPRGFYFFFGTYRSVKVPSNASAANMMVSDNVGWGWMVRPRSAASLPISIASATSEIRSPAFGPTMPPPITRCVAGSNSSFVMPSSRPSVSERPLATQGNVAFSYAVPFTFASVSVRPTQAT